MVDEVDETVRATFADMYQKGYSDGYVAGIAAALEKIQSLATENGVSMPSKEPSLEEPIDTLELSGRAHWPLIRTGIRKIAEIYEFHDRDDVDLYHIRKFGPKCFDELNQKLINAGYPRLRRIRV